MSDQLTLAARVKRWFTRTPIQIHEIPQGNGHPLAPQKAEVVRTSFLRPWARRDAAISNLQRGFDTLTDLMEDVRDGLDRQNKRQEELIQYLARLPDALQMIPEANRAQGETLKAIHQQIAYQSQQQNRVGNLLEKIGQSTTEHAKVLRNMHEHAEVIEHHNQMVSENLQSVGIAMQSVSRNTDSGTKVLQGLRERMEARDRAFQQTLEEQNSRFMTMLTITVLVSLGALIAICVMGFLLLRGPRQVQPTPTIAPAVERAPAAKAPVSAEPIATPKAAAIQAAPATAPIAAPVAPTPQRESHSPFRIVD